jgi:alpha-tubulin suppressor-like RCC1 family protein
MINNLFLDKGEVFTFGSNSFGQLGLPAQTGNQCSLPVSFNNNI